MASQTDQPENKLCAQAPGGKRPFISFHLYGIFFHFSSVFFLAPMHLFEQDAHFLLLGYDNCQFFILNETIVNEFT